MNTLKRTSLLVAGCLLTVGMLASGARADGSKYEALQTVRKHTSKIIGIYGAGVDVHTKVLTSAYSKPKREWLFNLDVSWKGPLTGDLYRAKGWLTVNAHGWTWKRTYANSNLVGWILFKGIVEHGLKEASTLRGSRLAGPRFHTKYPTGQYIPGKEKIRLVHHVASVTRSAGSSFPSWSDVKQVAGNVKGKLHLTSTSFYYSLPKHNQIVVLKAHNDHTKTQGYVVIFRSASGSFYTRSNADTRWKYLSTGPSSKRTTSWKWNNVRVFIDVQRPNASAVALGRQLDYRFRIKTY